MPARLNLLGAEEVDPGFCYDFSMQIGEPSRTALAVAMHRAAHQVLERGAFFSDPLALPILGMDAESIARTAGSDLARRAMRMFVCLRSRIAEDALAAAMLGGVRQMVVLGAGLDTFAYRSPYGDALRIFEVDIAATQAWKRERLAAVVIAEPEWLSFVPVDFERQTLPEALASAGFDPELQTFFLWLGVVPYLSSAAIWSTLRFIAGLHGGAHVVFDYSDPPETMDAEVRALHDKRARKVAELGERWVSYFEPSDLRDKLLDLGFIEVEDLRMGQMINRYAPGRGNTIPRRGGHVLRAWTV